MIRCGGSRPAFPARAAGLVWTRLRHGGARRRAARLRRSPRSALSALARRHARAGAVGVESGLVGGLSRAPVLSAGPRVRGSAPPLGVLHRAVRARLVPPPRLDRVSGAGTDDLLRARTRPPEWLARPAGPGPRPDALRRHGGRRRGRRARRAGLGAASRGARPSA